MGCEARTTMMPATKMNATETMTAEVPATMVSTAVTSSVTAAMATTMTATVATALRQSRARQQARKRDHGNPNDRSRHRTPPASAPLRHRKLTGIGTSTGTESSVRATAGTPDGRSRSTRVLRRRHQGQKAT
jgi:hypothetical protein